jgi:LysR family transcriptional regulator, transcriptional activator of the cysJI operon
MSVDALKVFKTVVEQKNFSKAADLLYISQPAVSMQIRNLENEFGAKLIHRTSKQLMLTYSGEILYAKATQILNLYEEAKQEINLLRNEVGGTLKIGASFTIGEYVLPAILGEYTSQYPNVHVEVSISNTEEILNGVKNGLDLGLVEGNVEGQDFILTPFMTDEMVLIAPNSHSLAKVRLIQDTEVLQNQTWIFREAGSGTRAYTDLLIQELGLKVNRSFVFSSSQAIKEGVINGLGISFVSTLIVKKELEHHELTLVRIKGKQILRNFSIIRRDSSIESKAIETFLQKLNTYECT